MPNTFEHIPHTVQGHFLLYFYAAVYRLIHHIYRLSQVGGVKLETSFERYPFLAGYYGEMRAFLPEDITWEDAATWWERQITAWEAASDEHLPLRSLEAEADVSFESRVALLIAGLVDEDSRFGTLFAQLQEPLTFRRPCLETIGQMMTNGDWTGGVETWSICRPLLRTGLVDVTNRDAPRPEWVLRVPVMLWDVVRGEHETRPAPWCQIHTLDAFPAVDDLVFPQAFLEQLKCVPALVSGGKAQAIVLRGMQGSERLEVLGAVARALDCGLVQVQPSPAKESGTVEVKPDQWARVGPLCTMAKCLPVVSFDLGPGETVELPPLTGYSGPVGVTMGFEGGIKGPLAEKSLTLTLPPPQVTQRLRHWQEAFAGHPVPDLEAIAERFQIPGGYIRQAGTIAIAQAALDRREAIQIADVREACRTLNRQVLDTLATRLPVEGHWDHLVVAEDTASKLYELERRCRHRERLLEHLGPAFGAATNRGVRALFTGGSGTGKTLAAKILAAVLDMDLYRVDLASVINKYIGETEKNLHRVLSRAEEVDVILLLDEGDALLGSRTEVKSANDRYANLETNYLLQRLETYQGIVVVTTNAGQLIDNAFQRRMDVVVNFVPPQAHERLAIWRLHLPEHHAVEPADLEQVAVQCAMTGGQIRNAALHATLLALDDSSGTIRRWHLEEAVQSEYRKAGAICPLNGNGRIRAVHAGLESFVDVLESSCVM